MRSHRTVLLHCTAALAVIGLGGCALFGVGELRCEQDDNCPSGMSCVDSYCAQERVSADASTARDAAGVDGSTSDAVALDRPEADPTLTIACTQAPCSLVPDSPTQLCANAAGELGSGCPAEGEALHGQDGNYLIYALELTEEEAGVFLERASGLSWEVSAVTEVSWETANTRCEDLTLAGREWRLPQHHELVSLVDYGRVQPAIDARFAAPDEWFWSASGYDGYYWGVDYSAGISTGTMANPGVGAARCVSGVERVVDTSTFQFLGGSAGGRWLDPRTGLEWQPELGPELSWADALASCQALDHADLVDWRLPSVKELESLVQRRGGGLIMTYEALAQQVSPGSYWSSTPCAGASRIWSIDFYSGLNSCRQVSAPAYVRCVRGPEP